MVVIEVRTGKSLARIIALLDLCQACKKRSDVATIFSLADHYLKPQATQAIRICPSSKVYIDDNTKLTSAPYRHCNDITIQSRPDCT